ncbi:hypothetical protein GDO78_009710 [Eleutherodactylus coqui]|uniref:Uncharacterized protein n=1 Tax=Eleutherodactylus coqui TaxID=57060 RepID=A0A8J6FAK1_ELECQ|nr:hypothetical protein GDO78_009710 [Eleutherodactylus coqui]
MPGTYFCCRFALVQTDSHADLVQASVQKYSPKDTAGRLLRHSIHHRPCEQNLESHNTHLWLPNSAEVQQHQHMGCRVRATRWLHETSDQDVGVLHGMPIVSIVARKRT